jgi:hypothetical protein
VVAAHQSGYQDVLADVSAHPPNTHTGQVMYAEKNGEKYLVN